ncbi:Neuropeptide CCHamide-1 receptor [Gryllus bimaculatus]|nr:Neuropeptide CCHamide-1 receptor [Gryllus bimaculatus]
MALGSEEAPGADGAEAAEDEYALTALRAALDLAAPGDAPFNLSCDPAAAAAAAPASAAAAAAACNLSQLCNATDADPHPRELLTYIVLGNGTLVFIFARHRQLRNAPNTYILSLALGDLLLIVTCVPFTSTLYTFDSWPYGALICKLSEGVKDVSIGVSVFTLTALSAER